MRALHDVSLPVYASEVLAILGESGCGKSTLANSVLGLLPSGATRGSGEIIFCGRDLLKLQEAEWRTIRGRQISWIPQDPALSLNPVITVGTQVAEVLRAHLPLSSRERRECVISLLREVGFDRPEEISHAYPHQLSGGQRQRVVIAQAVACRPALIVADEPTSKLDASLRADIVKLLSKIREQYGTAVLFITHDCSLLPGFADRVAVMYAGKIVEIGKCSAIFQRPLHPYTEALLQLAESSPALLTTGRKRLPTLDGELPDLAVVPPGCVFEPRCASRMTHCAQEIPRELTPEPARLVSCWKYGP